jgi:ribonuclease P protein component
MPRSFSLSRKKDFDSLFKKGIRKYSRFFTVVYAPADETKFGLIVQKKNVPHASDRNYCRRVMRETIRQQYLLSIKKSFHIAIIVKSNLKLAVKSHGIIAVTTDLNNVLKQVR